VPVVVIVEGITEEQYVESVRKLAGKERVESSTDWPVHGLLAHIAGQGENGFRVIDVWESQEALDAFAEQLIPVMDEIGVEGKNESYQTHSFVTA
jgi:hypothetical protein